MAARDYALCPGVHVPQGGVLGRRTNSTASHRQEGTADIFKFRTGFLRHLPRDLTVTANF